MQTIVTDQVNTYKSPMNDSSATKPTVERMQLVVNGEWVRERKLSGFQRMEDVERKIDRFIGVVVDRGLLAE